MAVNPNLSLLPSGVGTTDAAARLFCLPHAGGGTAPFHRWQRQAPEWLSVQPFLLPGREARLSDPPYRDLRQLVDDAATEMTRYAAEPYGFFGHSFGALVAFEITRELRRRGQVLPQFICIAACRSPQAIADAESKIHEMPDDEFLAALDARYGGIPAGVRENAKFIEMMLPAIRADFFMLESYTLADEPPLDVAFIALSGNDDQAVSPGELNLWREHTTGRFSSRTLPGGHFFPIGLANRNANPCLQLMIDRLRRIREQ